MRFNTENYKEVRAFSENQYLEILTEYPDEDFEKYDLNEEEGIFEGEIVLKKWGRKRNIICFINCGERAFKCTAFQNNNNYLGLADMPMGSRVRLTFKRSKTGNNRLAAAEMIG